MVATRRNHTRAKLTFVKERGGEAGHAHGRSLDSSQTVSEEAKHLSDLKH